MHACLCMFWSIVLNLENGKKAESLCCTSLSLWWVVVCVRYEIAALCVTPSAHFLSNPTRTRISEEDGHWIYWAPEHIPRSVIIPLQCSMSSSFLKGQHFCWFFFFFFFFYWTILVTDFYGARKGTSGMWDTFSCSQGTFLVSCFAWFLLRSRAASSYDQTDRHCLWNCAYGTFLVSFLMNLVFVTASYFYVSHTHAATRTVSSSGLLPTNCRMDCMISESL